MLRGQQTPVPASRYRSHSYYHTQKKTGKCTQAEREESKAAKRQAGHTKRLHQLVYPQKLSTGATQTHSANSQHAAKSCEVTHRSNQSSVKERVSMALPERRGLKHLNSHPEPATVTRKQRENMETEKPPVYRLNTAANNLLCPELAQCHIFMWVLMGRFRLHMDLHTIYWIHLTMLDRTTRWPEVVALSSSMTAEVAWAFLPTWVAWFGIPADLTSDRGVQFTSELWTAVAASLGSNSIGQRRTICRIMESMSSFTVPWKRLVRPP